MDNNFPSKINNNLQIIKILLKIKIKSEIIRARFSNAKFL